MTCELQGNVRNLLLGTTNEANCQLSIVSGK
jgi:hypothetical protein